MKRIVVEGNQCYEIDEDCVKAKERENRDTPLDQRTESGKTKSLEKSREIAIAKE